MSVNRISASVDDQSILDIVKQINQLHEHLPFLLKLSPEEKADLLNFGDNLRPFIQQTLEDARTHPHLVPGFLDIEELGRDLELFEQLVRVTKALSQVLDLVGDTAAAAGSDAFENAVGFYRNVRMAALQGDAEAEKLLEKIRQKLPSWKRAGSNDGGAQH